jgi:hypothetical protein
MSERFIDYLKREHSRLDAELEQANKQIVPDQMLIARLKKLKLAVKDQIVWHERPMRRDRAA